MTDKFPAPSSVERRLLTHVQSNSIQNNADSVLKSIDAFCWLEKDNWMMNVGDEKGMKLDQVLEKKLSEFQGETFNILELGAYCGYSSLRMLNTIRKYLDAHKDSVLWKIPKIITSIDPSEIPQQIAKPIHAFAGFSEENHHYNLSIRILKGTAQNILLSNKYDFVFIDHVKELYYQDLKYLTEQIKVLKPGCVVVADNVVCMEKDLRDYLAYVRDKSSNGHFDESELFVGNLEYSKTVADGMEISIFKKSGREE